MTVSTPPLTHAAPDAWSPNHPVLTTEGRRLLQGRADELRTCVLPALHTAINDPDCDGHTNAVYTHGLRELMQLDTILAEAGRIPTRRRNPCVVELGDVVTLEFLPIQSNRPADDDGPPAGSVERFLFVHPVEGTLDDLRVSAGSPLARAVLGRTIGNVVQVAAPAGSYPVRILATKRPRGRTARVVRQHSLPGDRVRG